jgi:hypothetical protein
MLGSVCARLMAVSATAFAGIVVFCHANCLTASGRENFFAARRNCVKRRNPSQMPFRR